MSDSNDDAIGLLLASAESAVEKSYAPYSGNRRAAALLLDDGGVVPGVRVENASFSLTIPAAVNAVGTAVALGRTRIEAVAFSHVPSAQDAAYLDDHPYGPFKRVHDRAYARRRVKDLPTPGETLDPKHLPMTGRSPDAFTLAARAIASRAYVPESRFSVGCLLELESGDIVVGVNVEHPHWPSILCAERNAIGTVISYGLPAVRNVYLSCPSDDTASPCGACRQVLVELAPEGTVWMDRGNENVANADVQELLPGHFSGSALKRD